MTWSTHIRKVEQAASTFDVRFTNLMLLAVFFDDHEHIYLAHPPWYVQEVTPRMARHNRMFSGLPIQAVQTQQEQQARHRLGPTPLDITRMNADWVRRYQVVKEQECGDLDAVASTSQRLRPATFTVTTPSKARGESNMIFKVTFTGAGEAEIVPVLPEILVAYHASLTCRVQKCDKMFVFANLSPMDRTSLPGYFQAVYQRFRAESMRVGAFMLILGEMGVNKFGTQTWEDPDIDTLFPIKNESAGGSRSEFAPSEDPSSHSGSRPPSACTKGRLGNEDSAESSNNAKAEQNVEDVVPEMAALSVG